MLPPKSSASLCEARSAGERGADLRPPGADAIDDRAADPSDEHHHEHDGDQQPDQDPEQAQRCPPRASISSRFRLASEKTRSTTRSTTWTTVPTSESIAPAVTAAAPGRPWHWKKRMLTAMRARLDGIARFRYDVVSSFM